VEGYSTRDIACEGTRASLMRIKSGAGLLSRAGRMQNGHGDATADGRNRYSTSIAERSNRMLLRSHELPCLVPLDRVQCAYAVAVTPHRARAALRRTCRESLDNKEIGRSDKPRYQPLRFGISNAYFSAVTAEDPYRFCMWIEGDARRAGPNSRNETDEMLPSVAHRGRLDIFRQYLPSSAGEAEILRI